MYVASTVEGAIGGLEGLHPLGVASIHTRYTLFTSASFGIVWLCL